MVSERARGATCGRWNRGTTQPTLPHSPGCIRVIGITVPSEQALLPRWLRGRRHQRRWSPDAAVAAERIAEVLAQPRRARFELDLAAIGRREVRALRVEPLVALDEVR